MGENETREYIEEMKEFIIKIASSKENSLSLLIEAGICTPDGKLREEYK